MRVNDAVIGLIAILIGIAIFWHVQTFPVQTDGHPGPALFPSVLSVLMIVAGIVLVIQGRRCADQPWCEILPDLDAKGVGNIVMTLLAIIFYIVASDKLGFLLTAFCVMFSLMLMLKAAIKQALPIAACMTLFIYVLFNKGLLVPLPRGLVSF